MVQRDIIIRYAVLGIVRIVGVAREEEEGRIMHGVGGGGDGGVEGDDGAVDVAGAFAEGGWSCGWGEGDVVSPSVFR